MIVIFSFAILTGCVSRGQISKLESKSGDYFSASDVEELLRQGLNVGNTYLSLSDRSFTTQDAAFVTLLALAAGAAVNVADGGPTNDFTYAGIAGLAVNQTAGYFNPQQTGDALLGAAERQFCVVSAGHSFASDTSADKLLLRSAFLKNKFRLRRDLNRTLPSYETILNDLKRDLNPGAVGFVSGNQSLNQAVNACFNPASA